MFYFIPCYYIKLPIQLRAFYILLFWSEHVEICEGKKTRLTNIAHGCLKSSGDVAIVLCTNDLVKWWGQLCIQYFSRCLRCWEVWMGIAVFARDKHNDSCLWRHIIRNDSVTWKKENGFHSIHVPLSVLLLSSFVFLLLRIEKGLIRSGAHTYLLLNCNVGKVVISVVVRLNNNVPI